MFNVYILKSKRTGRFYTGSSWNLEERLQRHNDQKVKSTKFGVPWEIVYSESYNSRQEAYKRELQIKSYKGGEAFKELIKRRDARVV